MSSYHWKDAVSPERQPMFDKSWRVEDPNTFGTDEYAKLCQKLGCEPYICPNAGTGTAEEMSDRVEYCNLENEGKYAKWRIPNGYEQPHSMKNWSVGNENYGHWELGGEVCLRLGMAGAGIRQADEACGSHGGAVRCCAIFGACWQLSGWTTRSRSPLTSGTCAPSITRMSAPSSRA